ncbi:filament-like plant protein [Oryza brachyantha]|uniref:filament-like plant protein n=1 Tax=Oryza brachyantha TaxID=4533 RepID=UPI001ADAE3FE|nr:filament-like plant protein [Oryza brachyantha]
MDRRSWLWRRRSSEKSPAETESSVSSPSERLSDEQDTAKSSPSSVQSPEIVLKEAQDDNVKVKVLSERLSSAVLDIRAKDDLVKQHSKVAEEAVLGWEKAEKEIASLKTQLNAANVRNSTLEDKIVHLDGALKECVRQLRHAKEDQDQKVQDALAQQSRQWESKKTDLELRIVEFKAKLEAKTEFSVNIDSDASSRLASLEKENSALKVQLLAKSEELELRTIEKELNRRAAETASKQQLESIKKIAKLEAECRRLQANARRPSFGVELRRAPSSVYAESVTDCQSDCSDSWASALITELDQFKNDKSSTRSASITAADIGMMDDFLEMEKLALANNPPKSEVEDASGQLVKFEEKIKKLTSEKADREKALHEAQRELRNARHRTMVAEEKSVELQRQLNLVKGEKHSIETEMEAIENRRNELEGKLELAHDEITSLMDKGRILEERLESEKALTLELAAKYQKMDELEAKRKELRVQLEASQSEARKLSDQITSLERKLEKEKAFSTLLAAKCHDIEAMEEKKKGIEHELESAREEIASLHNKVSSLELKIQEEKALSTKLAARSRDLESLDVQANELRSQLQSANSEIAGLNEKVKMLEEAEEKHMPLTSGLESQLKLAQNETMRLKDSVRSLEKKLESQKNLSSAYITALDASEAQKNKFASRFELKEAEVEELHRKFRLLEDQIREERARSSELGVQCINLKEQIASRALSQPMKPMANKELHIKKEKEVARAAAAGKLADCQKTIASLSRQLKSLADFDEFVPGFENDSLIAESWEEGDLKPFNSANYPAQLGCLAVK